MKDTAAPFHRATAPKQGRRDAALGQYFKDLRSYPPLSGDDEIALARRLAAAKKWTAYAAYQLREILNRLSDREAHAELGQLVAESEVDEARAIGQPRRRARRFASAADLEYGRVSNVAAKLVKATESRLVRCAPVDRNQPPTADEQASRTRRDQARNQMVVAQSLLATIRRQSHKYEQTRTEFCEHNLRLVVAVAKSYRNTVLPLLDLIQEGNLGLMAAIERFDERRGCRFATYAVWWIRRFIREALIGQGRPVSISSRVARRITEINRMTQRYLQETERPPTLEQMAVELGASENSVAEVLSAAGASTRLDDEAAQSIADPNDSNHQHQGRPLTTDERDLLQRRLTDALATLNSHERKVCEMRFGLGGKAPCNLREVGAAMGLSSKRIRQLEKQALHALRKRDLCETLLDFVNV